MLVIPTAPIPFQTLQCQLNDQACTIEIFQEAYGLYVNLTVNDSLVVAGVIAENLNRIVRNRYLGFVGDLVFQDLQGTEDPVYTGLGDRFVLLYIEEADALLPEE